MVKEKYWNKDAFWPSHNFIKSWLLLEKRSQAKSRWQLQFQHKEHVLNFLIKKNTENKRQIFRRDRTHDRQN
jgi:hypothetical protein